MRLVVFGPPAAGKGTQADILSKRFNIPHISTGDIFRHNIHEGTPLGIKAEEYISNGKLVPDEIVLDLVEERIKESDCQNGFLFDGFPRTLAQAKVLDEFLDHLGCDLDAVINIDIDDEEIVKRVAGRRICRHCKKIWNINEPGFDDKKHCKLCGGTIVQRSDDKQHVVMERLKVYHEETKPLIDYYRNTHVLIDIDGLGSIDKVASDIENALGR